MRVLLIPLLWITSLLYAEGGCLWENDFSKSVLLSREMNKEILLFFTGSDWSGPSMKMKKEILDSAEFRKALQDRFIFVQIDFPMHTQLEETRLAQNTMLKEQFAITSLPTLLLLNQNKREITRLGYLPEEKENVSQQLLRLVEYDKKLEAALALLENKVSFSGKRLKELYTMAEELGRTHEIEILLREGMASDEKLFFMLKLYQQLVQNGQMIQERTKSLRQQLWASKEEEICYSIALIDFQELSKQTTQCSLPEVIAPLKNYLSQFDSTRSENVWRTEMMIAQVYMTFDLYEKALYYARRAYEKAPAEVKSEIAHSLSYIEDQHENIAVVD
jgi:protein disulfide-isomerase